MLAQSHQIDDEVALANLYAELSWEYRRVNVDSSLHWAEECIQLSKALGNDSLRATGLNRKGIALSRSGQYEAALVAMHEALELREKGGWSIDQAKSHIDIANMHFSLGEVRQRAGSGGAAEEHYGKAHSEYETAMDIARSVSDTTTLIKAYSGLGAQYFGLQEDEQALETWLKALRLAKAIGDHDRQARLLLSIGTVYRYIGDHQDSAVVLIKRAQAYFQASGDVKSEVSSWINLGEVLRNAGDYKQAIDHFEMADSLAQALGDVKRQAEIQEVLSLTHDSAGNVKQALVHHRAYLRLNQELLSVQTSKALEELQVKYQTQKKEQQNTELRTERTMLIQGLIAIALLLLIAVLYFLYYRQRQLSVRLRDRERIHDLMSNQDRKLINAMLEGQEQERQRISSDLHDRMGSILSALKLYFGELSQQFSEADQQSQQRFDKTGALLEKALRELRAISRNLVSGVLLDFGLLPALQELTRTINDVGSVRVELRAFGLDERLPSSVELPLFRMAQELLTNALKHAEASTITLTLHDRGHELELRFVDDGKGFVWPLLEEQRGLGIAGMQKRIEALGGSFELETSPGKGTRYTIAIPLPEAPSDTETFNHHPE